MKNFNPMQMFNGMNNMGYNPMMQMMQMMGNKNPMNAIPQMMGNPYGQNQNSIPKLNKEQFKQYLPNMNDNIFEQLKNQARAQGISDADIDQGMKFIKELMQ